MVTLREWFDTFTAETGERPESIVLAWGWSPAAGWPDLPEGVVSYDELEMAVLDHKFSDDYGGTGSPDLCAWSSSWVLFSDQYDGSETLRWVPRSPVVHTPIRPGG